MLSCWFQHLVELEVLPFLCLMFEIQDQVCVDGAWRTRVLVVCVVQDAAFQSLQGDLG
jgi:hypothetical protein